MSVKAAVTASSEFPSRELHSARASRHRAAPLRRALVTVATLASLCLAGHAGAQQVFAAASMKDALDDLCATYARQTGKKPVLVYGASSTLARQIEKGAPADVFISADQDWMDYAQKHDLIDASTRRNLLGNALVLIAPATTTGEIDLRPGTDLDARLGNGRLAMGDPAHVPAGLYGKAALEKLGVWPKVQGKVAAADNVRNALLLVARGEAPYGIVYKTDANAEKRVRIAGTFPADSHAPIVYPVALTKQANRTDAEPFYQFLQTPAAQATFERYGFGRP
ncbi:molybdate ABC transporter substrate-binding protein [Pandoraea nosoerga]|uniref:Molybdate-binding periplasmic ABC transporter n=1 Tax=Pandoraea nosoerga TaxID=2508296 RepID=A0A5E4XCU8_9BURK|nr:molybdate ABC transporter substrate-binding protein [Pandoraea nosoerga]MBN4676979.1 molybdate ABC transporter substrate-binding protein [Pandoraea nosoerga]MBN4681648.1 molybdate ABC transporter substrate-binding protein [Pandoraea nosoerga]MBN4745188.1 molybdate ABC transporter substrate-binding protein [Pandoraea nosoerga]VVE34241.1 Putative molybdate-binding periplasmic ABC transporter [Pandoraea nosoerga]